MQHREEIRIRDPFIFADKESGYYYMYGTTELFNGLSAGNKFAAYRSRDLENFEGPFIIFDGQKENFWADRDYWAAEMHAYKGKYYLFASFKAENHYRASQILVSDAPLGEFKPLSQKPTTPENWECLDGTLWIENDEPYIIFCREWLEVEDGEIWAMKLNDDLSKAIEKPFLLFRASDNKEVESFESEAGKHCRITDAPFLFKEDGKLKMIWSSIAHGKYAVLEAESDSGLKGTWTHKDSRFTFDGGHAMLFTDFSGKLKIALHAPNNPPKERANFFDF